MREPRVHAGYMKDITAALAKLGREGERVRAADLSLFRESEESSRSSWLPISMNLRWVDASASVRLAGGAGLPCGAPAGPVRQRDVPHIRAGRAEHLRARPRAFDRLIARRLSITFRDCGEWGVERVDDACVVVRAAQLPKEVAGQSAHALGRCKPGVKPR